MYIIQSTITKCPVNPRNIKTGGGKRYVIKLITDNETEINMTKKRHKLNDYKVVQVT